MATTPDLDMLAELTGNYSLTSGTNLFAGPVVVVATGVPDKAVFILATGGAPPQPFIDGSGQDYCRSAVQIRIRSTTEDFPGGQTLARNVRDFLHKRVVSGYVDIRAREAEPNYLGPDEQGHHEWSVNLDLEHRR